jgi:hypothetical protein
VAEAGPQQSGVQTSTTIKVKENIKTASYGIVIVFGLGVTGVVIYTVFSVSSLLYGVIDQFSVLVVSNQNSV